MEKVRAMGARYWPIERTIHLYIFLQLIIPIEIEGMIQSLGERGVKVMCT